MNNTFDIHRFGQLFLKDLRSIYPLFGRVLIGLALVPLFCWTWNALMNGYTIPPDGRQNTTFIIMMIVLMISPAILYGNCNRMKKGIHFAMLPASKLEKYLSMILVTAVVCPVLYVVATLLVDMLLTLLPFGPFEGWFWESDSFGFVYLLSEVGAEVGGSASYVLLTNLLLTSSLFMFTNTIFKKNKALNTILWCIILSFVLSLLGINFMANYAQWFADVLLQWIEEGSITDALCIGGSIQLLAAVGLYAWGGLRLKNMCY